jgi:hypothetical protein
MDEVAQAGAGASDRELLRTCSRFREVEAALDCVCSEDRPHGDLEQELHREWVALCLKSVPVRATTRAGLRAKAGMLLAILAVVVPPTRERKLHELLAESLARDLLETLHVSG